MKFLKKLKKDWTPKKTIHVLWLIYYLSVWLTFFMLIIDKTTGVLYFVLSVGIASTINYKTDKLM